MYGEDWDLCLRARQQGVRCLFCSGSELIHYGGASEPLRADKLVRLFATKGQLFRSHWKGVSARALYCSLWLFALRSFVSNAVIGVVRRKSFESARVWKEVIVRRDEWT